MLSKLKVAIGACLLASTFIATEARAGTVAILEPTVSGGMSSQEAQRAIAQGHTVTLISAADWSTMTEAQFSAYDALVLGDPTCQVGDASVAAAASNLAWAHAADGNVIIIGSDPVFHYVYGGLPGASTLMDRGIGFATAQAGTGRTGAYITLSCYYHFDGSDTHVPFLDGFGTFAVVGSATSGALNEVHIVAAHPALAGLTDGMLSNWHNSVHESFGTQMNSWPSDFEVLAVAEDGWGNFVAPDGTIGFPYIIARGVIPDRCGNGTLDNNEECDDGNNNDHDGCSASCNREACPDDDGDTVCNATDRCQGNDLFGDTDLDGICGDIDVCPNDPLNDDDGDGVCGAVDNCPFVANANQADVDGDGIGDACDPDWDNDGVANTADNCPYDANPDQADTDHDGAGNACDSDYDGDGVIDSQDACLPTPAGQTVNSQGCSLAQLCPCENNWRNHGAYVSCNARQSTAFVNAGLMSQAQKDAWMSQAGQSSCGQQR